MRTAPRGSRRTTSTSKIRNRIVTRKNRSEKGVRALLRGSNPHSNGVSFSRCFSVFFPRVKAKAKRKAATKKAVRVVAETVYNNRS